MLQKPVRVPVALRCPGEGIAGRLAGLEDPSA
jgi:hypothetical protein